MAKTLTGKEKLKKIREELSKNENYVRAVMHYLLTADQGPENPKKYKEADEWIAKLSRRTGLPVDMILKGMLMDVGMEGQDNFQDLDMCLVYDAREKFGKYLKKDVEFLELLDLYPISINIHRYSSQRDVLDFIRKNWKSIQASMYTYTHGQVKRIKPSKIPSEIVDCVWENRRLTLNNNKKILDERYPGNKLTYNEISKIISVQKKKRTKKL